MGWAGGGGALGQDGLSRGRGRGGQDGKCMAKREVAAGEGSTREEEWVVVVRALGDGGVLEMGPSLGGGGGQDGWGQDALCNGLGPRVGVSQDGLDGGEGVGQGQDGKCMDTREAAPGEGSTGGGGGW